MNFKNIVVIWLTIAAAEARFEDFVVKDRVCNGSCTP